MKLFSRKSKASSATAPPGPAIRVVWGASWHSVESSASMPLDKAAQSEARRRGATHYALASNGKDAVVGLPPRRGAGRGLGGNLQGCFLAAQMLASVSQASQVRCLGQEPSLEGNPWQRTGSLAYLGAIADATFVFAATIDGVPFLDLVGSADEIRRGIDGFRERLRRGVTLLVQDRRPVAEEFGSVRSEFGALAQAVAGLPYDANLARIGSGLQPLPVHPAIRGLVGTAAVMGLCALGWWAYTGYVGHALSVEQLSRREQQAQAIRQKYIVLQQEVLGKESAVIASGAAEAVWAFVAKIKTARAGFDLEKVVCRGGACDAQYRRVSKQPTFADFVKTHVGGELPRFDLAHLDEATTALEIPDYDTLPALDLRALRHDSELVLNLGTTAQQVLRGGVKLTFSSPADMVPGSEEFKLMRPTDLASQRRLYGTWSLEGPTDTFTAALKRLPAVATLSEFEVRLAKGDADGTDTVVARGRYFLTPTTGALR